MTPRCLTRGLSLRPSLSTPKFSGSRLRAITIAILLSSRSIDSRLIPSAFTGDSKVFYAELKALKYGAAPIAVNSNDDGFRETTR
ncbi:unnamed protein product [Prunus armeniaca]|uniref:Uncharacterized protein n=1 Tax=Prunus armeniaca TaxID=36596 RepID=A0A6J5XU89_PRUAR|nr:unnamed protein product [Prunus armeniaca]